MTVPYIVETLLYTGQSLWSKHIKDLRDATRYACEMTATTMVEDAYVIDIETGEVLHTYRNLAVPWRKR